jgi:hypothetical protein
MESDTTAGGEFNAYQFGWYVSLITAILTIISFGIAICTPPLSGPFCSGSCFEYPFTDIAGRFPRDYYWMYPAIILSFSYLTMMIALYHTIPAEKRLFGMLGVAFAIMASFTLASNYFIQVSVVQPALLAGETDGISLISQFNPHGIFIVLEEIGFTLMVISFFVLVPVFDRQKSPDKAIIWIAVISLIVAVIAFALISAIHGIHREYRYEVVIITIVWLELIVLGFLFSRYFIQKIRS